MRFLTIIFLFGLFVGTAHLQTPNMGPAGSKARTSVEQMKASAAQAALGNEKLAAGDIQAAAQFFKAAAMAAPKPLPQQLFNETLVKLPANLYFRGLRSEALEITGILEDKAETNAGQILNIAAFYISIENGSEARRVTENAIRIEPISHAAYQTLGLANRVDFKLEESAAAYAKALEIEPDSLAARRGLAEMKRSLGKPDEAAALYREILAKDEANLPARTGLILALFDGEKRAEAEAEMTKALEANPGNVILLAGAAYWYAARSEGKQAETLARKAIESDPRFIWSHLALARALLIQNKPLEAEKTLLAARRYGNFPTLEYEIASAKLAAGLYREAAEELAKSFAVKEGVIHAKLGGRVPLQSKNFTELVGFERRASIFAPTAADNPDNAAKLKALLEFNQELDSSKSDTAATAGDNFISGGDKMKAHRQLFVASQLLEKKIALPKAVEIARAATSDVEAGLDIAEPATAVMASELYERRAIAATKGQYINVPQVQRNTLLSVLRGRIEEIIGWSHYQMDDAAQAVVHLKRAVGVLPVDSAWWRSSTWRLGTALVVAGKDVEALEAYIKYYKSTGADAVRYKTIEAVYRRVNGNTLGLPERIGRDPSLPAPETVAKKAEPTPEVKIPEVKIKVPSVVPIKDESAPTPIATPESKPMIGLPPVVEVSKETTPSAGAEATPVSESTPAYVPLATPTLATSPTPEPTPLAVEEIQTSVTLAATPKPLAETPRIPKEKAKNLKSEKASVREELFPPVIITIPAAEPVRISARPSPTADVKPCSLFVSDENLTFDDGSDLIVTVRRDGDRDLESLTAVSNSPENVGVSRKKIDRVKSQASYVVRLLSSNSGEYKVLFEMPCGKKEIAVTVP